MSFRTLKANEIEVKVKKCTEKGVVLVLYKTARVDMDILDESGEIWCCDYKTVKDNLYCGIGIKENNEWIWRWDCGIESREDEGNEKKGEASDAFKRAGFKWGIGRELYTAPFIFVSVPTELTENKKSYRMKDRFEEFTVSELEVKEGIINKLVIVNKNNDVVFPKQSQPLQMTFSEADKVKIRLKDGKEVLLKSLTDEQLKKALTGDCDDRTKEAVELILERRKYQNDKGEGELPF